MPDYTLYIGSDHRGYEKKTALLETLAGCHPFLTVEDCGPFAYDPDDDFNDAAVAVCKKVLANEHSFGILLCGSAHGVTMQANRFKGIRAIHAENPDSAKIGRMHDHANVLCLSADDLAYDALEPIIKAFCHARPDQQERYLRRVQKLDQEF